MAQKKKINTVYVDLNATKKTFVAKLIGQKNSYDFSDIKLLRSLLSNEKARILIVIKAKNPSSIYGLSKILKRDFKSVREDIKILERFGFIDFIGEKIGRRISHRPVLTLDKLNIEIKI
jgi:predicted transcriptional regulator